MLDRIDIAAASSYLHRVMNRCAEAAFESNPVLDDLDAPDGVRLMLRADGETGKLLDGSLTFDPPVPASDIGSTRQRFPRNDRPHRGEFGCFPGSTAVMQLMLSAPRCGALGPR